MNEEESGCAYAGRDESSCTYTRKYKDPLTRTIMTYKCKRRSVSDRGSCIFHDLEYFMANMDDAAKEFNTEIRVISNQISMLDKAEDRGICFIGCNIPRSDTVELRGGLIIRFNYARFHEPVRFANFDVKLVDLSGAKFNNSLDLVKCKIRRLVSVSTTFDGYVSTVDCNIKDINLSTSQINDKLTVLDSNFEKNADFHETVFSKDCLFYKTTFGKITSFMDTEFKGSARFHHVDFLNPDRVKFQCESQNISLLYTDVTSVWFSPDMEWGDADKQMIYDERNMMENKTILSAVKSVYRDLRENYEIHMDYPTAGKFFVREMELERLYYQTKSGVRKKGLGKRILSLHYELYKALSCYGENLGRIIKIDIAVFFGSVVYFSFSLALDPESITGSGCLDIVNHALSRALGGDSEGTNVNFTDHLVRGIGLLFIGMTFVSIKRKLERRFRH